MIRGHCVCVLSEICLLPYTTLLAGETGTVVSSVADDAGLYSIEVLMDLPHKGLAAWDNQAHLMGPELALCAIVPKVPLTVLRPNCIQAATVAVAGGGTCDGEIQRANTG